MKPYNHLPGYLHRWRLAGAGRFMARLHRILDIDRTPFLHTHPFAYVSIVLRGGYDERVLLADGTLQVRRHRAGAVIVRGADVAHRIDAVRPGCATLFLAWRLPGPAQGWRLQRHPDVQAPPGYANLPDGLYSVPGGYRWRGAGIWYAARPTRAEAVSCERLSIHQNIAADAVTRLI